MAIGGISSEEELREAARQELERRREYGEKLAICQRAFLEFLPYWQFINRETGKIQSFSDLWEGQRAFADMMERERWVFALKAGKLGFTELECAFDGWVALFRQANARVHLFSKDGAASKDLLGYIRFGLTHLPVWMRPRLMEEEAGGDTTHSLKFKTGPDDVRTIVSYAASANVSIDQSCAHAHVDELANMRIDLQDKVWHAIYTTVAPGGSCHIVTRGAGEGNFAARLWQQAVARTSNLTPFFQPWTARAGRDALWYEEQQGKAVTHAGLAHFAPSTWEDALMGDETSEFIPIVLWDACREELATPGGPPSWSEQVLGKTSLVLGMDAGVSGDCFAIVAVSRHPKRPTDLAVRAVKLWKPPHGGKIDFSGPEQWVRELSKHYNLTCLVYDPFQLHDMCTRLYRDDRIWTKEFPQQKQRLISDSDLRTLIVNRRIGWAADMPGGDELREHLGNAGAKLEANEESKIRIVKKSPDRKVDLAVALSMATYQCLHLYL